MAGKASKTAPKGSENGKFVNFQIQKKHTQKDKKKRKNKTGTMKAQRIHIDKNKII